MLKSAFFPRVALAVALLWLACCSKSGHSPVGKTEGGRKSAPEFSLKDANGQTVRLADYRGKVVLLDFWATWCGPCKVEIPWFIEFERQFKDRGFAVVGVSMDEDGWNAIKPYVHDHNMNYRVLLGNDEVGSLYGGVDALPTTFLIDRQGGIVSVYKGLAQGKEEFKNDITRLLESSRTSGSSHNRSVFALLAGAE